VSTNDPGNTGLPEDARGGRTVGRYELLQEIGIGGMSRVYRARDTRSGEIVAIKIIGADHVAVDAESRLEREPEIQRGLGHENIVHLIDSFRLGDEFFLVMEYIDGRSLARIIHSESGPLPLERARGYFRQLLRALEHLHRLGIIHRDIKPSNVLIGWDDRARLADFGIAKFAWHEAQTSTQRGLGTPEYMSPEQARGGSIDYRSDVYSVGISLFEALTGRRPFMRDGATPAAYMEVVDAILNKSLPDPRIYNPAIPDNVVRLLRKATAKNPDERFQSCAEMLGALEVVGAAEEVSRSSGARDIEQMPTVVSRRESDPGATPSTRASASGGGRPQISPSERRSNPWPWVILAVIVLAAGGYAGWPWIEGLLGRGVPPPGTRLNDSLALVISRKVAADVQRFTMEGNPPALASLYAEQKVRFFNLKSATRKAITSDLNTLQKRIVRTERFDIEIRRAHAVTDSLIETEWIISYQRVRDDSTLLRGTTSNLLSIALVDDEWLIVSQREKWSKRDNTKIPKQAPIDSAIVVDSTSEPTVVDIEHPVVVTDEIKRRVVESAMKGLENGSGGTQISQALSPSTPPGVREELANLLTSGVWRLVSSGPEGERWGAVADVVGLSGEKKRYRFLFTIVDEGGPKIRSVEARPQ